ncbi:LVIVD repeat-containing protein [Actinomadura macrotermitis]|uniref:LVIVD repeat-containing protein n=1 Tax=Actinomadura macrotermitis TaxID=2585200 RepID=A0A7K0C9F1_9ACTN|nr:hypothetical protein [Actinomadura macrotermitis]MQY09742.1 hypothetical protein [Actinomadura macrotermitis]
MRRIRLTAVAAGSAAAVLAPLVATGAQAAPKDPYVPTVCGDRRPQEADPAGYGMQLDGTFRHPSLTPPGEERHPFPGGAQDLFPKTKGYDPKSYTSGPVKLEASYRGKEFTPDYFHTWQNIVDFKGRRYLFQYDRSEGRVYDITDVRKVKVVEKMTRDDVDGDESKANGTWAAHDMWGASTVQWNKKLNAYVMVQSFEAKRQVAELGDSPERSKFGNPAGVAALRKTVQLKGFKVYRLDGPRKKDWKLLSTVSTDATQRDPYNSDMTKGQQGSGSLDVPYYTGGKYMFIAAAPRDSWGNSEVPTNLYSAGYLSYDMSDPAHPRKLGEWHLPGQVKGEEAAYRKNPRCGNQTSWNGARMPLFIPKPVEEGGRYGFAAQGGFGFSVLDISDPAHMKTVSHIDLPMSVGGTEADNIDVSQYARTGMVYVSGYPLGEDCYEPYKDIFQVDVRNPAKPRIVGALPRPVPPRSSGLTDFCQRGGSFGPKRTGYYTSPGTPPNGLLTYGFYNAGVQFFDVKDKRHPKIAGQFVPVGYSKDVPDWALGNQTHGVYVEWDRKIVWVLTNDGIYALSSRQLIGKPRLGAPSAPFRNSGL